MPGNNFRFIKVFHKRHQMNLNILLAVTEQSRFHIRETFQHKQHGEVKLNLQFIYPLMQICFPRRNIVKANFGGKHILRKLFETVFTLGDRRNLQISQ